MVKIFKFEGYSEEVCLLLRNIIYLPFIRMLCLSKYGAIVSIADKIETLISIFISGKGPSGSSDPYAEKKFKRGN